MKKICLLTLLLSTLLSTSFIFSMNRGNKISLSTPEGVDRVVNMLTQTQEKTTLENLKKAYIDCITLDSDRSSLSYLYLSETERKKASEEYDLAFELAFENFYNKLSTHFTRELDFKKLKNIFYQESICGCRVFKENTYQ